jgi:hypothetical protein
MPTSSPYHIYFFVSDPVPGGDNDLCHEFSTEPGQEVDEVLVRFPMWLDKKCKVIAVRRYE